MGDPSILYILYIILLYFTTIQFLILVFCFMIISCALFQINEMLSLIYLVEQSCRYVFTADPRGRLKLWRLPDPLQSNLHSSMRSNSVSHVAEFISSYGMRIMCLDACLEEEVFIFPFLTSFLGVSLWCVDMFSIAT